MTLSSLQRIYNYMEPQMLEVNKQCRVINQKEILLNSNSQETDLLCMLRELRYHHPLIYQEDAKYMKAM